MLTVCIAEIVYLLCTPFYQINWVVMALCGFCLLEVFMHTFFGFKMYHRFKKDGKKTIYNPGFASAFLGFGMIAISLIINFLNYSIITSKNWLLTILLLLLMAFFEISLPERLFRSRKTNFAFSSPKYFTKFLNH